MVLAMIVVSALVAPGAKITELFPCLHRLAAAFAMVANGLVEILLLVFNSFPAIFVVIPRLRGSAGYKNHPQQEGKS
jgi:hypothetical protein